MSAFKKYFNNKLNESTSEYPKSISEVNKFLKSKGVKEVLVKGKGYFYFAEGDAAGWYESSVSVYNIDDLSFDQWFDEWKSLKNNNRN